jgi:2-phosphosulfolactate phosphatase
VRGRTASLRPARIRLHPVPPAREPCPRQPPATAPVAPPGGGAAAYAAVVIDVLRTTSTLAYAFAGGAREAQFFAEPDLARAAQARARRPFLLCGEREGLRIRGFDLGNSPFEYPPERVRGATLLFASTNGSLAFLATHDAAAQWAAAFVNVEATVRAAAAWLAGPAAGAADPPRDEGFADLHVVCAGKLGEPAEEDTACGALFVLRLMQRLAEGGRDAEVRADGGVLALAPENEAETRRLVAESAHGRYLASLGPSFVADVEACGRWDVVDLAPAGRGARLRA